MLKRWVDVFALFFVDAYAARQREQALMVGWLRKTASRATLGEREAAALLSAADAIEQGRHRE